MAKQHQIAVFLLLLFAALPTGQLRAQTDQRPNILWLSSEDHGQEMGCYGDTFATTPTVDVLAKRGMLFRNVWSCFPVCAPARTTIITGMYPTRLGAEHMRSMVNLPGDIKLFPELLLEAGYYCTNRSKEDYNVASRPDLWNESSGKAHWRNRQDNQAFFSVFNSTRSHESSIRAGKGAPQHDPAQVRVPAYHPDTAVVRRDWAIYYDTVTAADAEAGKLLEQLAADGLNDSTIVFYWGDHGSGMPRSKRWPSDSGLRVPLVVYVPEAFKHLQPADYQAGGASDRLVSFVDFAPTTLSLAGVKPPDNMDGRAFMGKYVQAAPQFMYGFRGRMDERLDLVRSVSDGRFVYLRNYMPHLSQAQHVSYQFETPSTAEWFALYQQGKLNASQSIFWKTPKASEELYDLQTDRDEVINLATSPAHQATLEKFRQAHREQVLRNRDVGFVPEGERRVLAGDRTIMKWGSDDTSYPLERIFAAAALASTIEDHSHPTVTQVTSWLDDQHSVMRYWGCLGLLMRGPQAIRPAVDQLRKIAMTDSSDEVRIAAAQAVVASGDASARAESMGVLIDFANWQKHSVFASMAALRAISELETLLTEQERTSMLAIMSTYKPKGQSPDGRYDSYVPRLLQDVKH